MLLSRGRRWETTSEKRGVWPFLTDCGTCTRTRLTISRRAREAGVRAPACGPIKIVQVCDPDQILTLTAHLDKMVVSTKCACETTMRQHLDNIEHVNTEQFVTRARVLYDPPPVRCGRRTSQALPIPVLTCHMWSPEIDCIRLPSDRRPIRSSSSKPSHPQTLSTLHVPASRATRARTVRSHFAPSGLAFMLNCIHGVAMSPS